MSTPFFQSPLSSSTNPLFIRPPEPHNYRHFFLRRLIQASGNLCYGFLLPANHSLTSLGKMDQWKILVRESELEEWKTLLYHSPYTVKCVHLRQRGQIQYRLHFRDRSQLSIHLVHRLDGQMYHYLNIQSMLSQRLINRDGLPVVQAMDLFEYEWLWANFRGLSFNEQIRPFVLLWDVQDQIQIVKRINRRYRLNVQRIWELVSRSPGYKSHILLQKSAGRSENEQTNWRNALQKARTWMFSIHFFSLS